MKAERLSKCRYNNAAYRVSNSQSKTEKNTMCVALEFFAVLIYPNMCELHT